MVAALSEGTRLSEIPQVELFRLAALVYSEFNDEISTNELLFGIIKSVFVEENNQDASVDTIIANVLNHYKTIITEDETIAIINQHYASFESKSSKMIDLYRLTDQELKKTQTEAKDNIEFYITQFAKDNHCDDEAICRKAIYNYLYKLMTTNINSYQILLSNYKQGVKFYENDIFIDIESFNDIELKYIKGFLEWDNQEKDTALFNVVSCCLEYCLLVAGDAYSIFSQQMKKSVVFLDTNILFRALGINGKSRQDVIISFLKKVKQADIKVVLNPFTKQEFLSTIDRSIVQISSYNSGEIYYGAYEQISDYNIFSYYYDWLENHKGHSIKGFRGYIHSALDKFIIDFDILSNYNGTINIYSKESLAIRKEYEAGITEIKSRFHDVETEVAHRYDHDASLVYVAEETYKQNKQQGELLECMVISTDKVLRYWDVQREGKAFPIVIYPSQLFLILVKVCGRSTDDLKSFISFINVKNHSKQLSPEKANVVLAGISAVTTDLQTQKILVGSVFSDDFQRILRSSNTDKDVYEKVKNYGNRVLQDKLDKVELEATTVKENLSKVQEANNTIKGISDSHERDLIIEREEKQRRDKRLLEYAQASVKWKVILRFWIFPIFIFCFTAVFLVFVLLQFLFCKAEWNIVTKFIDLLKNTTFGKDLSGIAYCIDGAILAGLVILYRIIFVNKLLEKDERETYLNMKAQLFIKKKKLM